jgi:hypothetical protein
MSDDYMRWFCCSECEHVQSYKEYPGGHNTFPRGEWIAHQDTITTGFKSREKAQEWLDKELAKKATRHE